MTLMGDGSSALYSKGSGTINGAPGKITIGLMVQEYMS